MPQAVQLPYVKEPASQTGRRLFRVQVLPKASVEHPKHGSLDFTTDRLKGLVERFRAGAYDQVPFLIADKENNHTDDPERFRGEVKGLELSDDGLYASVEMTDSGSKLLADNPRLPVSVRLVTQDSGRFKGEEALAHLLGTLDPVVKGMKPWEAIEASADTEVLDLSGGSFSTQPISKDADTQGTDALSDEEKGTLRSLFEKIVGKSEGDPSSKKDDEPGKEEPGKKDEPEVSDAEVERVLAQILKDEEGEEAGKENEPVAASLTDEDRKAVDLATERAENAEKDAREMTLKAGRTELSTRFKNYVEKGVPPAMIEAAKGKIEGKDDTVLDFARGKQGPELDALFAALEAAEGTIEFTERGSSIGEDEDEGKDAREKAEAAHKAWTGAGSAS